MLESIREANKEAELFKKICCCLLPDEKKLKQILDRCQYDEGNSEWILPVIKSVRDSDFRLPDIDSKYGTSNGQEDSSRGQSATRRPQSGQNLNLNGTSNMNILPKRPSSRSSRDDEAVREKQKFNSNSRESGGDDPTKIPSLNVPSYAPAKPPMPRSARKDKKKTKSSNSTPAPTGYEPVVLHPSLPSSFDISFAFLRMSSGLAWMLEILQSGGLLGVKLWSRKAIQIFEK